MPHFYHSFDPNHLSPVGPQVDLSSREVADAGLKEILQTPGVALGQWSVFDELLEPNHQEFLFREPLGQSREVKTALSGLFGRFVARAYAERYLGYSYFVTISNPPMRLASRIGGTVNRCHGATGDLPDWVAWGANPGFAIIEAKGTNDKSGPEATLRRAFAQAERAEILRGGTVIPFKRYAIAARWGVANPYAPPYLSVQDPAVEGDEVSEDDLNEMAVGLARLHYAALLRPIGQVELAESLARLRTY